MRPGQALAVYALVGIGFAAGKLDLDVKLRDALRASQERIALMNANAIADALERRKLGVAVKESPTVG